jgi:hypothetical protein
VRLYHDGKAVAEGSIEVGPAPADDRAFQR